MSGEEDAPLIESRADLLEVMAVGSKPKSEWRVGTEHEKHVYRKAPLAPVPYAGDDGVHALLQGIEGRTGWHPFFDRGNPIGLRNLGAVGGISLEPGGQFELSGAPQLTIHDAAAELDAHLEDCRIVGGPLNIHFLSLGVTPLWSVAEIAAMPKSRYGIMTRYMQQVGSLGTSMMYRSATVQANLDFSDEADMVKKLRVSVALQPIVTALFANSPFVDGKPSGYLSFRSHIWLNTDNARTGMLPFAFEPGFGFDRYAEYALDVPMYFVIRKGEYINVAGESFRAFMQGEQRAADMGDRDHVLSLAAIWTGLLYDSESLDAAWDLVSDWTDVERQTLRNEVPRTAIHTPFRGGTVADIARLVVDLAGDGLRRRKHLAAGKDETSFLAPLNETLELGKTQAERWLDKYNGAWAGDLTRIFEEAEI